MKHSLYGVSNHARRQEIKRRYNSTERAKSSFAPGVQGSSFFVLSTTRGFLCHSNKEALGPLQNKLVACCVKNKHEFFISSDEANYWRETDDPGVALYSFRPRFFAQLAQRFWLFQHHRSVDWQKASIAPAASFSFAARATKSDTLGRLELGGKFWNR